MYSAFSIASVDNIDHAAPGKGINILNHARSFHGIILQHVATKPASELLVPEKIPVEPQSSTTPAGLFSAVHAQATTTDHPRTISKCHCHQHTQHCMTTIPAAAALSTAVDLAGVANASSKVC